MRQIKIILPLILLLSSCGKPGEAGKQGQPGVPGVPGDTGVQGPTGLQGPQGAIGETGAMGATGTQGPKGDTGATGATGAQGPQGPQGVPGVSSQIPINGSIVTLCSSVAVGAMFMTSQAVCINAKLYVMLTDGHTEWLAYMPNGTYYSAGTGLSCSVVVNGCTVSPVH